MNTKVLLNKAEKHLKFFCNKISERSVGSKGNRMATSFFEKEISTLGWSTEKQNFKAIDWKEGGAKLQVNGLDFKVLSSPYSLGCKTKGELVSVSSLSELKQADVKDKILLLYGDIAKEQLMPKNFVFYNPKEHQEIISLLETKKPKAIISATGRNSALAGGVYPFPLIEDGDFNIPSVYMTEYEGKKVLRQTGKIISLKSVSKRIQSKGCNIVARKGKKNAKSVVITAHIDAKKGTPGAIDNAGGVVIMLLLAELLSDYSGKYLIEIVALNGEDYYAVPGQMLYVSKNKKRFDKIALNINIDGAGYKTGKSAVSLYGLPKGLKKTLKNVIADFNGLVEGVQWPQGDHSIFVQHGRPAIAVSSKWFTENINAQKVTHTKKDNISIVDCRKLVEIAQALNIFVRNQFL